MGEPFRVLIAGGGTGGHVFPGVAVADALARRVRDLAVCWVGTDRGLEAKILADTPYHLETMDLRPLNGVRGAALAKALGKLPGAGLRALSILRAHRPEVVLGVGGYAGGPVVALAAALKIPAAVLEPNAIPGLTNRLLARFVKRAFVTHQEAVAGFPKDRALVTGSPVRRQFLARMASPVPVGGRPEVLVLGGSQGARALNRALPAAFATLRDRGLPVAVTHQAGAGSAEEVSQAYRSLGVEARVVPFIADIAEAMERASLLVCRAGAMTVAEVGVLGRPALYVPLPTAADDHQRRNAEAQATAGAARWLAQAEATPERLADELGALLSDPEALRAMGAAAWQGARPDAAGVIADELLALAREGAR